MTVIKGTTFLGLQDMFRLKSLSKHVLQAYARLKLRYLANET